MPEALEDLPMPAFAVNRSGILIWLNAAARSLVGDMVGARNTDVFAAESKRVIEDAFARKTVGTAKSTDYEAVLVTRTGGHVEVEISSVRVERHGLVAGIFGIVDPLRELPAADGSSHLTPRQAQVLRLLGHGASTEQIAAALGVTRETARNHVRDLLQQLGVHSRLEAVVAGRERELI